VPTSATRCIPAGRSAFNIWFTNTHRRRAESSSPGEAPTSES
jgi:hypothetical protein